MKARAKRTDNGEFVYRDLEEMYKHVVDPSTIEYEINGEWYTLKQIEKIIGGEAIKEAEKIMTSANELIEKLQKENNFLRLKLIEVKGERDREEKENARLKAELDGEKEKYLRLAKKHRKDKTL